MQSKVSRGCLCAHFVHPVVIFISYMCALQKSIKSVSIGKPGGSRQGVIILKSPIWLKLGTNVRYGELTIV